MLEHCQSSHCPDGNHGEHQSGEAEQVIVALLQTGQVGKAFTTEVLFSESALLYHGAHGTVKDEHTLFDDIL